MRRCLPSVLFAVAMTASVPAVAQDCPPGAWFCEEVAPPPVQAPRSGTSNPEQRPLSPAPAGDVDQEDEDLAPPPPPDAAEPEQGRHQRPVIVLPPRGGRRGPPPIVIVRPGTNVPPAQVVIVAPGAAPPAPPPPPARVAVRTAEPRPGHVVRRANWHRRWGLNMRLEGASFGGKNGAAEDAGMGGFGLSLRFRPVPAFAFDAGIDVLGGTDFNGFQRTETPLSLSAMVFVNPRSRVQFYMLGGLHISHASVESDVDSPLLGDDGEREGRSAEYNYFGGQGGVGLEFRISRLIALNVDALAFIRKRSDDGGKPEFIEPETGRTANSSAGGLFRGGLTFWW